MSNEGVLGPLPRFLESCAEMLSGSAEPAREDATVDEWSATLCLAPRPRPRPVPEMETEDSFGSERPAAERPSAAALCAAACAAATAAANSDSFSPTQDLTNQRPPAMPRTSRLTCRHFRTGFPLLSRGITGAKPVPILGGGWTGLGGG